MKIQNTEFEEMVPEGDCEAELFQANEIVGPFGPQTMVNFRVEGETACLVDWFNARPSRKLKSFLEAVGLDISGGISEIDFRDLIGRKVKVKVQHITKANGETYANIVEYKKPLSFN